MKEIIKNLFMFFLIIFILSLTLLCSCNSKHCIKYENDKYGNFEYCYDATSTEIEGVPVFTNENKDSLIAVEEGFLDKIKNTLVKKLHAFFCSFLLVAFLFLKKIKNLYF
jgi:hypothetical protein